MPMKLITAVQDRHCETVKCQGEYCGMRISDNDSDRYERNRTYRHTATTVLCCRGCSSDDWMSRASRVLLQPLLCHVAVTTG